MPRADYAKIRELEFDLGFEERPERVAIALLKELHQMPFGAALAAAQEIQSLSADADG